MVRSATTSDPLLNYSHNPYRPLCGSLSRSEFSRLMGMRYRVDLTGNKYEPIRDNQLFHVDLNIKEGFDQGVDYRFLIIIIFVIMSLLFLKN